MAAVEQNGLALEYVPKKLCDHEMCMAAVKQDSNALRFVPDELKNGAKTAEEFLVAMKNEAKQRDYVGMSM